MMTLVFHAVNSRQTPPFTVTMEINDQPVETEIDTGASVSILSEEIKDKKFNTLPMQPSGLHLQTYTAENIKVLGKCKVNVKYGSTQTQ